MRRRSRQCSYKTAPDLEMSSLQAPPSVKRTMTNDKGQERKSAGPSIPVNSVSTIFPKRAALLCCQRRASSQGACRRKQEERDKAATSSGRITLDNLFAHIKGGEMKGLPSSLNRCSEGSVEASKLREKLSNEGQGKVVHGGVGAV